MLVVRIPPQRRSLTAQGPRTLRIFLLLSPFIGINEVSGRMKVERAKQLFINSNNVSVFTMETMEGITYNDNVNGACF